MKNLTSAAFVAALLLCGVVLSTACAQEKNTLTEDFTSVEGSRWTVELPLPGSSLQVKKSELMMANRAYIVSKQDFAGPLELSLKWTHKDNDGGRLYADAFQLTLHSSGGLQGGGTRELKDGVQVRLTPGTGLLQITQVVKGEVTELFRQYLELEKDETKQAWPPLSGEDWYHIKIKDDGAKISASVSKNNGDPFIAGEGKYDAKKITGHKIVLGNREIKGPVKFMTSYVQGLSVKPLKK
jgi:hypothetical protein